MLNANNQYEVYEGGAFGRWVVHEGVAWTWLVQFDLHYHTGYSKSDIIKAQCLCHKSPQKKKKKPDGL